MINGSDHVTVPRKPIMYESSARREENENTSLEAFQLLPMKTARDGEAEKIYVEAK